MKHQIKQKALPPDTLHALLTDLKAGLVAIYGAHLRRLVLYESYARGAARPGSDLDVAVVLDEFDRPWPVIERTGPLVGDLSLKYAITISLIPMRKSDWDQQRTLLAKSVQRKGVEVG